MTTRPIARPLTHTPAQGVATRRRQSSDVPYSKISTLISQNVIDLDMRILDSYSGTGTVLVNLEGDNTYDIDFAGLTVGGTAGTGDCHTVLSTGGDWSLGAGGSSLPFFNALHKDTVADWYIGVNFTTGATSASEYKFLMVQAMLAWNY